MQFHFLINLCAAGVTGLVPADFSGTFRGDELTMTLTLTPAEGRHSENIKMQERHFRCNAREINGRLAGAFESEGCPFEFSASLQGEIRTFVTAHTTCELRKEKPASVNPLAKPALAGQGAASVRAQTNASSANNRGGLSRSPGQAP